MLKPRKRSSTSTRPASGQLARSPAPVSTRERRANAGDASRHEAPARPSRGLLEHRALPRDRRLRHVAQGARDDTGGYSGRAGEGAGLRGRGGAGFGTGQKWSFLPKGVYPRYLAVNADEGEPSTFKDHMLVERDPHQLIEGIVISAFSVECHLAFVYVRGEFALGYE